MYLEISNEAYTRTITQGVRLSDKRGGKYESKRSVIQNARISQTMNRAQEAVRRTEDGAAAREEQFRNWEIVMPQNKT
jgi:translation initiation factor 2B subunit (eIF-2B alpha/beta/delta family)